MRSVLILALLLFTSMVYAQQEVKAYLSAEDFAAGISTPLPNVTINSVELRFTPGEFVYHLSSTNKKTYKQLLFNCWAVERNDSLFLHSNEVFKTTDFEKKVYALVLFRSSNYLHFRAGRTNMFGIAQPFRGDLNSETSTPTAINIAKANSVNPTRFHYLYDINGRKVIYFNRGVMRGYVKQLPPAENKAFISYINKLIAAEE